MTPAKLFRWTPPAVHPLVPTALLGFASGLPFALTGATLKLWLTTGGVDLTTIGLFGLITQPYALKFLWAPFLDRYAPPGLGRRRGWLLVTQVLLALGLLAMARWNPSMDVWRIALLGCGVALASASQDVVFDAWRAEAFPERELGLANSVAITAYRGAMLVSAGLALALSDRMGWGATYTLMGLLMGAGLLGTLLAPSTDGQLRAPRTLLQAYVGPFREMAARRGILEVLAFCILYKVGDQLAEAMTPTFLKRGMGFSLTVIGVTFKTVGMTSIMAGGILGGLLMRKVSLKRCLMLFGILQGCSILSFWALSQTGPRVGLLALALCLENLSWGMGGTALVTLMMEFCDKRFTAAQYALLSSIAAVSRSYLAAPTGWLAAHLGWSGYYLFCAACALPGLLLLLRYDRWARPLAPGEAPVPGGWS